MSINIVHLTTGEQIICKLTEAVNESNEPVCFVFTMPMSLVLYPNAEQPANPDMNFFAWSPFSKTREFRVGFDRIVCVAEPTWNVYSTYVSLVQPLHPILSVEEFEEYKLEQQRSENKND